MLLDPMCLNRLNQGDNETSCRRGWADHSLTISFIFADSHLFLAGGHEDFSKMIDEAEPLGYPVVVKSTRGHQGQCFPSWASWVISLQGWQLRLHKWKHCLRSLQGDSPGPLHLVLSVLAFVRPLSSFIGLLQ